MKLNVLLIAYNTAEFIEECVNSILMQKTDFDFNIIVADDCSTDGTLEKIKLLDENSPVEFVYLKSEKNLGFNENYKRGLAACDAEYIAPIDSDDYWTTPYRLQQHVDFLDEHRQCAFTWNSVLKANYGEMRHELFPSAGTIDKIMRAQHLHTQYQDNNFVLVDARDIIKYHLATNDTAFVYRKSAIEKALQNFNDRMGFDDFVLSIQLCQYGLMGFILPVMSVYRTHSKNMSSALSQREGEKARIARFEVMDAGSNGSYHKELSQLVQTYRPKKNTLGLILRFTPPFVIWIMKAILPRWITDKLK